MSGQNVARLIEQCADALGIGIRLGRRTVRNRTGDYNIVRGDLGATFTNEGATGAINFIVPDAAEAGRHHSEKGGEANGGIIRFRSLANQNFRVSAKVAGQLVVLNDDSANFVEFSTTNQKIGGGFDLECTGTKWIVIPHAWDGQTVTVGT